MSDNLKLIEDYFKKAPEKIDYEIKDQLQRLDLGSFSGVKTLERAGDVVQDNLWIVNKNYWDSLMFEAKRDIKVYAIGIFGPKDNKPREFTVGYKYNVQDGPEGKVLMKSPDEITEEVKCPPAN